MCLCLIHELPLERYLQQNGWCDEDEGAYWRIGEDPDRLFKRAAEARNGRAAWLTELSSNAGAEHDAAGGVKD